MKSLTQELWLAIPQRRAIVSLHPDIERLVADSGVQEGQCLVNAPPLGLTIKRAAKG